jgi:hypothetical protein
MEPIDVKIVDAIPIDMSTRVLLVDEEADVDASLREVPEQNRFHFHLWQILSLVSTT